MILSNSTSLATSALQGCAWKPVRRHTGENEWGKNRYFFNVYKSIETPKGWELWFLCESLFPSYSWKFCFWKCCVVIAAALSTTTAAFPVKAQRHKASHCGSFLSRLHRLKWVISKVKQHYGSLFTGSFAPKQGALMPKWLSPQPLERLFSSLPLSCCVAKSLAGKRRENV